MASQLPERPAEELAPKTRKARKRKNATTFSRVAQKQLKKAYRFYHVYDQPAYHSSPTKSKHAPGGDSTLNDTSEQPELKKWEPRITTTDAKKDLGKIVRARRNPENKNQIQKIKMTTEGKYIQMLFARASKNWSEMEANQKKDTPIMYWIPWSTTST